MSNPNAEEEDFTDSLIDQTVKRCKFCGKIGHIRRSHTNCDQHISRIRTVEVVVSPEVVTETTESIPEVVTEATEIIFEASTQTTEIILEAVTEIIETIPEVVPQSILNVTCRFCGLEGHERTAHYNCLANPRRGQAASTIVKTAYDTGVETSERHKIGEMNIVCTSCGAYMWIGERKSNSTIRRPKYQLCCGNGKSILEPLKPLPDVIKNFFLFNNECSREFKKNIRTYNSALSFTSMNANLDHNVSNSRGGAYAYRIHGSVFHLISTNLTSSDSSSRPKFAQIYIFDSENELRNRMDVAGNPNVTETTMLALQNMMHQVNPFVRYFKTMEEVSREQNESRGISSSGPMDGINDIRMVFRSENTPDPRRYNAPTAPEIGVLILGGVDNEDMGFEPTNRDIIIRLKGSEDTLSRIKEINQFYDPLQYVLMFPEGDPGWNINLMSYEDVSELNVPDLRNMASNNRERNKVTIMDYYSFRLMLRPDLSNGQLKKEQVSLHNFGKLFHQYIVDMYAKMEQQRLNFVRHNQATLRSELYNGLSDAIRLDDNDMSSVGKKVILPSTFVGSPRFLSQLFQDAMSLVRRFGKPDLFITFTCNPSWPAIEEELLVNQNAADRPDLCARVFNLKLRELLNDITRKNIFGKVVAYCYSIEFQKRGLPHAHILIILRQSDKPQSTLDYDKIVSAEIPDPTTHDLAYKTVTTSMIHGPCGLLNPNAPCMKSGRCTKNYPHDFQEVTATDDSIEGGYPVYRRRRNGRMIIRNNVTIDNRWVVPHNLYLSAKFDAHINVEICSSVNSVKYIYKYVYKGNDRAAVNIEGQEVNLDEIDLFLDARYVSAAEACWRIFSFPMHKEYPSHQRLAIHLEGEQEVFFEAEEAPAVVLNRIPQETTLTAWLKYNRTAEENGDLQAKTLLYSEFCEKYTFCKTMQPRQWKLREKGITIGRIYSVSPQQVEKYHLRLLLHKIRGAKSFADIRTVNGQVYLTYQAAARAMGLLSDDIVWSSALEEAATCQMPLSLRRLFVVMLSFCECSNPFELWLNHKDSLSQDYFRNEVRTSVEQGLPLPAEITGAMYGHCLLDLNDLLAEHGIDLKTMEGFSSVFPETDTRSFDETGDGVNVPLLFRTHNTLIEEATQSIDPTTFPFNEDQKIVFDTIRQMVDNGIEDPTKARLFFVDGPGGTGKTFLFNALLDYVRRSGNVAISVASTGAAALLLKGGRTSHSVFNIPIKVTPTSMCGISPRSNQAELIRRAKLIVWDEASMTSKSIFEAVDRTFKDIFKDENLAFESTPFGGRLIVFGGDFRQVLPVMPNSRRSEVVRQCMNRSQLWPKVQVLKLRVNMRVQQALQSNDDSLANNLQQFADYLLEVGEGKIPTLILQPNNMSTNYIPIPVSMHVQGNNLLRLVEEVYPDLTNGMFQQNYFASRSIMTPKNFDVTSINTCLLNLIPGNEKTYYSTDEIINLENRLNTPVEFLNAIDNGSLPPHELILKIGTPVMLLRNLDPASGLCNGTRLIVRSMGQNVIEAELSTGPNAGDIVYIPRIRFHYEATGNQIPIEFRRTQFPLRLAFAMTINKAQGQTLDSVGLYLPTHVFSHGQLYVALSRVKSPTSIKVLIEPTLSTLKDIHGHYTQNVVYKEVFLT